MHETQLILDRLVVIKIEGSLWSGRKKLRKEDLILADGSVLPPEGLASLGSKRIADPNDLRVFNRLKKEAERLCLEVGSRFLGGIAIPEAALPRLQKELERIADSFEHARKDYLERYDETLETWVRRHPEFAEAIRRALEPAQVVERLLRFDYVIFRVKGPDDGDGEALTQRVDALSDQLFEEIALMARQFAKASLIGKEKVTRKVLSPLRRMKRKLEGLIFLDGRVGPVIETLKDLLERAPRTGEIEGIYLREVLATALLLSDPASIRQHGEGLLQPDAFAESEDLWGLDHLESRELPEADMLSEDIDDGLDQADPARHPIPRGDTETLITRNFWF